MRTETLILLIVLCATNIAIGDKCADKLDLDCLYAIFFEDDSSSEESSSSEENQIVTDLGQAVSNLSTTIQNTLFENKNVPHGLTSIPVLKDSKANLKQVPSIVSYLVNLTKIVKNVRIESSNHKSSHGSHHKDHKENETSKSDSSEERSDNQPKLKNEVSELNILLKSLSSRIESLENEHEQSKSKTVENLTKSAKSPSVNEETLQAGKSNEIKSEGENASEAETNGEEPPPSDI